VKIEVQWKSTSTNHCCHFIL